MLTRDIEILIQRYLKNKDCKPTNTGWVMCSCPFAPWTHAGGTDVHYSFGISVANGFNCFACGQKGSLYFLPQALARYTKSFDFDMDEFIREKASIRESGYSGIETVIYLSDDVIEMFPYAEEVLSLTKEDIRRWNIRYDSMANALLFPIYHNHKLHSIKVRNLKSKVFWTIGQMRLKQLGNWYGEHIFEDAFKWLVLVEGERDAILLGRYIPTWASLGNPTKVQLNRLASLRGVKLLLAYDNDKAGEEMTNKTVSTIGGAVPLYRPQEWFLCKDPAEIVEKGLVYKFLRKDNIKRIV